MNKPMKYLMSVLLLAPMLAACSGQMISADQRVRQLMGMWESGDLSGLEEMASSHVVYDDVPNGLRYVGIDGLRKYVGHVHSWASHIKITVTAVHSGGNSAVAEWIMRGVQDRPIPGRFPVATNRAFELRGVTIIELDDGRIHRAADYMDILGFVAQLGARMELPEAAPVPPRESGS